MHDMLRKLLWTLSEKSLGRLWLFFFMYATFMALFVQFILLPYILPQWHAGDGLLASYFDSITAHKIADSLAERIHHEGWSVWELRPRMQGQAGIAAAIYALTIPKPWVLIPLLAVLCATATFTLFLAINSLVSDQRVSLLAVFPFFLYPSALSWYTQLLKDGYLIAGVSMMVYGWVVIGHDKLSKQRGKGVLIAIALIVSGTAAVWIVRPYMVKIMYLASFVISLLLTVVTIARYSRRQIDRSALLTVVTVIWVALFAMTPFKSNESSISEHSEHIYEQIGTTQPMKHGESPPETSHSMESVSRLTAWINARFIPIIQARKGFQNIPNAIAASNIDSDIKLETTMDVMLYLPRAVQLAFLAPFPVHWFGEGSMEANTMMRRVTAFEMLGVYFAMFFFPYAVWHWRKNVELWIILIFCVPPLLIQGIVVVNIGTLYRMRYGFIMTLVAIGLAGFITLFRQWKHGRERA
ncbi:MAG: hypothetical protein ACOYW7_10860 [Nitrospirota bacterium]